MGWSIGYDNKWKRDIGYGVPAICDHPVCDEAIDRGLGYVCGGYPYGGEFGCGLFFCSKHQHMDEEGHQVCERCRDHKDPFDPKPDTIQWVMHKLAHFSWQNWRDENPEEVAKLKGFLWNYKDE